MEFLYHFVLRHTPEQYGYFPDGDITAEPTAIPGGQDWDRKEAVNFRKVLKSGNFWTVGITEAIRMMILMAVITHVMPYLSSIGMSRPSAALVATSIPLFSIIGRFGFGWLGDIFDKKYVMAWTFFLFGIGTLAFSYIHQKWLIVPFVLLFSPAYGGGLSVRGAIVRDYFGRARYGTVIGIIFGMAAMGGVIGPFVAGWAFDTVGSYQSVWLAFAGTTVIAIILLLRLKSPHQMSKG